MDDANRQSKRNSKTDPKFTHNYNVQPALATIKFDKSDCEEDLEREEPTRGKNLPPNRPAPEVPISGGRSTHVVSASSYQITMYLLLDFGSSQVAQRVRPNED